MKEFEKALGNHIIVEYYNCDTEILKNWEYIEKIMNQAAKNIGATIVSSVFHKFNPWGVSGAVIIAESHLTIHTCPEHNYAAVDLFTCGKLDPWVGFEDLKKFLKASKYDTKQIQRGLFKDLYSNNRIV